MTASEPAGKAKVAFELFDSRGDALTVPKSSAERARLYGLRLGPERALAAS